MANSIRHSTCHRRCRRCISERLAHSQIWVSDSPTRVLGGNHGLYFPSFLRDVFGNAPGWVNPLRSALGRVCNNGTRIRFRSLVRVTTPKLILSRIDMIQNSSLTLRGYLTVYVNLCWAFGQLIAAGVLDGFANSTSEWAYRVPFAIQWVFPIPLFAIIWFCPESPWHLVRKGKIEEAGQAIRRLTSNSSTVSATDNIALIQHTNKIEDEEQSGTSYLSCLQGTDLRRTEIVCMVFAAQIWCGSPLGGTPAYFFVQAGLSASNAFKFSVGGLGLASIGTIISWALINRFGRRTLYVWGLGLLAVLLLVTGIVAAAYDGSTSSYIQAGFIVAWLLVYYLTVGPVCYAIISETSAVRLRNKSVCLSRIAYYISQVIGNTIEPYMVNPGNANWKGKAAFFWAGTCFVFFIWTFFRLPETKDRSYEELNVMFTAKLPARKFNKVKIDAYAPPGERIKEE